MTAGGIVFDGPADIVGDSTLMRISRSDVFTPDTQCFGLLEQIRDSCISTLQVTRAIEHKLQSAAFIIPPHIVATLE